MELPLVGWLKIDWIELNWTELKGAGNFSDIHKQFYCLEVSSLPPTPPLLLCSQFPARRGQGGISDGWRLSFAWPDQRQSRDEGFQNLQHYVMTVQVSSGHYGQFCTVQMTPAVIWGLISWTLSMYINHNPLKYAAKLVPAVVFFLVCRKKQRNKRAVWCFAQWLYSCLLCVVSEWYNQKLLFFNIQVLSDVIFIVHFKGFLWPWDLCR